MNEMNDSQSPLFYQPAQHSFQMKMVDLHGMSPERAKTVVNSDLSLAQASNITTFRFVTGRGNHINTRGERGTLYQAFPEWISEENHQHISSIVKKDGYYEVHIKPNIKKQGKLNLFFKQLGEKALGNQIKEIQKMAEAGEVESEFLFGYCYECGIGIEKDEKAAARWYRSAAEKGNAMAQHYLGGCYWQGKGVRQNDQEAMKWFETSASNGHEIALDQLGDIYLYGDGLKPDSAKAFSYYQKASQLGLDISTRKLGHAYAFGRGVKKDEKKAFSLYQEVADRGDPHAAYNVGCCYFNGIGTEKNNALAFQYTKKAADKNDSDAQYQLSQFFGQGIGVKANKEKALMYLQLAADNGHKDALFQLALSPERNQDKQDKMQYFRDLIKAAKAGQIIAQAMVLKTLPDELLMTLGFSIADQKALLEAFWKQSEEELDKIPEEYRHHKILIIDAYMSNQSFTKNQKKKILKMLHKLAEKNYPEAYERLGAFYFLEEFSAENHLKAKAYFLKGAELGSHMCLCSLGYYYEQGKETDGKPDDQKAFYYHQKAAEKGSANSHNQLGLFYRIGKGVEPDDAQALYHFREAMILDHPSKMAENQALMGNCYKTVYAFAAYNAGYVFRDYLVDDKYTQAEKENFKNLMLKAFISAADEGHEDAKKILEKLGIEKQEKLPAYEETSSARFWDSGSVSKKQDDFDNKADCAKNKLTKILKLYKDEKEAQLPSPEVVLRRVCGGLRPRDDRGLGEQKSIIKYLITQVSDVDAASPTTGATALHNAVIYKQIDAVNLLLEADANPNIPDKKHKTPIDYVLESNMEEIKNVFKNKNYLQEKSLKN